MALAELRSMSIDAVSVMDFQDELCPRNVAANVRHR